MNSFIDSSLSDVMPGNMLEPLSYTFNPLTDNLSSPHQIGGSFSDDGFVSGMIRALGQLKQAPGAPGLVPKTARLLTRPTVGAGEYPSLLLRTFYRDCVRRLWQA